MGRHDGGAAGAVAASKERCLISPAYRSEVVHTHYAGAAYSGGLLYGLFHGWGCTIASTWPPPAGHCAVSVVTTSRYLVLASCGIYAGERPCGGTSRMARCGGEDLGGGGCLAEVTPALAVWQLPELAGSVVRFWPLKATGKVGASTVIFLSSARALNLSRVLLAPQPCYAAYTRNTHAPILRSNSHGSENPDPVHRRHRWRRR